MYLKRLELYGFKSFGRRVSVELDRGLNAVVGPNGCGKSNLLDAIRWALGEPSVRALRGGRIEDIIFGGTRDVRPVGMAEVVLTFENDRDNLALPYGEVEIVRRAYRSGQSFFAINGSPCRLRDIHELLSRSNFGARSHALVPQGSADVLVVGSGEERRAAIDEVAGVARFRQLAALARASRDRAGHAIERAAAALGESARHVAFLERQAARARRARELYEARVEIDRELARRDARTARAHWQEAEASARQAEEQLGVARTALHESRQRLTELLSAHGEVGSRLADISSALEQRRQELLQRRHDMERAQDREFEAAGRLERARARLAGLSRQAEEAQRRIDELSRSCAEAAAAREQAEAAHRELTARLEAATSGLSEKEQALEAQRSRLLEALEEVARARNELLEATRQHEGYRREWQQLDERSEKIATRRVELERRAAELARELADLDGALAEKSARRQALLHELSAAQDELARLEAALRQAELEASRVQEKLRVLRQAHEELEGFSRGVRAVMEADAAWRPQIRGPLAQLVRVPEGLEEAAAAALGAFLEAVVVDTADAARQAIEYIRERRRGWATFLPLDYLRPRRLPPGALRALAQLPGFVGVASELLEVEEPLRPALEYAAGRVAVMERLSDAIEAGRRVSELARVVTREGEVVVPGGPVSGGHRELSKAEVLARGRQIEELRQQAQKLKERRDELQRALAARRQALEALRRSLLEAEASLQELRGRRSAAAGRQEPLAEEQARLQRELAVVEAERRRLEQAAAEAERREEELRSRLESQQAEEQRWRQAVEQLTAELERSRQGRRDLEQQVMESLARLESMRAEERVLSSRLEQAQKELADLRVQMEAVLAESTAAQAEMEAARAQARTLSEEVAQAQLEVQRHTSARAELTSRLEQATRELDELRQRIAHLEKSVELHSAAWMRAERAHQAAKDRWEQAKGRLRELSGTDAENPDELAASRPEIASTPRTQLERRRQELQAELDRIGSVDMQAIQAYEQARQEFEQAQTAYGDLLAARQALDAWQQALERVSAARFVRTLEAASREFDAMIRRLFGGGEGDLRLEGDAEGSARVELEVRLPAKRPQPAVALSGGERALVFAAFIFALQKVRPSPICVLDELDAALDEQNLERLVSVVQELAQDRQILFITHRQRTMEAATSLFGVTMDEQGVSRLLVLRLGDVPRVTGAELDRAAGM